MSGFNFLGVGAVLGSRQFPLVLHRRATGGRACLWRGIPVVWSAVQRCDVDSVLDGMLDVGGEDFVSKHVEVQAVLFEERAAVPKEIEVGDEVEVVGVASRLKPGVER